MSWQSKLSGLCKALIVVFVGCVSLKFVLGYFRFYDFPWSDKVLDMARMNNNVFERFHRSEFPEGISRAQIDRKLCSADSGLLLDKFVEEYRQEFSKLALLAKQVDAVLLVLYVPIQNINDNRCQKYFYELANQYRIELVDLSLQFSKYSDQIIYLLPDDIHLSRFAHQITADALIPHVQKLAKINGNKRFDEVLARGGLPSNIDEIRLDLPNRPYRLVTNKQGFRVGYPVDYSLQRILVLGDSFSFGPYLPYSDTYSGILNFMAHDKVFINAGISGYTIHDEFELFENGAQYVAPDMVILQVSDNDISDLFWFMRNNKVNKQSERFNPSVLESEFIDALQTQTQR